MVWISGQRGGGGSTVWGEDPGFGGECHGWGIGPRGGVGSGIWGWVSGLGVGVRVWGGVMFYLSV